MGWRSLGALLEDDADSAIGVWTKAELEQQPGDHLNNKNDSTRAEKMLKAREEGISVETIARRFTVKVDTVYRALKRARAAREG